MDIVMGGERTFKTYDGTQSRPSEKLWGVSYCKSEPSGGRNGSKECPSYNRCEKERGAGLDLERGKAAGLRRRILSLVHL